MCFKEGVFGIYPSHMTVHEVEKNSAIKDISK